MNGVWCGGTVDRNRLMSASSAQADRAISGRLASSLSSSLELNRVLVCEHRIGRCACS
jgi:hypothetical protein